MGRPGLRAARKTLVLTLVIGLLGLSSCTPSQHARSEHPVADAIANAVWGITTTEVCTPVAVPDGAGGVYVAYQKNLQGLARIAYLQRLDADGKPLWHGTGPKLYLERDHLGDPVGELVPAGDGVILVWNVEEAVWAQKVDSAGNLLWGKQGIKLNMDLLPLTGGWPGLLKAVSDGAGGVVVAAYAGPPAGITLDRLDASGKSVWSGGRRFSGSSFPHDPPYNLDLAKDTAGDFFVGWSRSTSWGMRKLNAQGESQWGPEGVVPLPAMSGFYCNQMVADGAGGAIVLCNAQTEEADAFGKKQWTLVAQHFDTQGKPVWPESGLVLATSTEEWPQYAMIPDGMGGAVIAWQNPSEDQLIYAQRVNAEGHVLWGAEGMKVTSEGRFFSLTPGNQPGESLIAWAFLRQVLRAQKLTKDGTLAWGADAAALAGPESVLASIPLVIVADGEGGAWITWAQGYFGGGYHNNITYIQRVGADGQPLWGERGVKLSALR